MISGVVLKTQPDAKLAQLAGQGSEAAFEALVHRYRRPLLGYCRRLLLSESRSEDVVQQALLNAWSALRGGAEVKDVKAWLYRITHNQGISALRRPGYDFTELNESLHATEAPDLDRRIAVRETLAAVAALPQMQREAILRTAIDGRSYEEVGVALGLTDQAVRGLVHRARLSLRSGLAAIAPGPIVLWAAGDVRRSGGFGQRLTELLAGGGSAGSAVVALKGAAVLASSAVAVGGTVTIALEPHDIHRPRAQRVAVRVRTTGHTATAVSAPITTAPTRSGTSVAASGGRLRTSVAVAAVRSKSTVTSLGSAAAKSFTSHGSAAAKPSQPPPRGRRQLTQFGPSQTQTSRPDALPGSPLPPAGTAPAGISPTFAQQRPAVGSTSQPQQFQASAPIDRVPDGVPSSGVQQPNDQTGFERST